MCRMFVKLIIAINLVMVIGAKAIADNTVIVSEGSYNKTISSRPAAGYFIMQNLTGEKINLISAASEFADRVELHTHKIKDGVMSMIKLNSMEVEADASLEFKSGGNHLMIFGLNDSSLSDQGLPVQLKFSSGKTINIWLKKLP